jgi:hypothetical protein
LFFFPFPTISKQVNAWWGAEEPAKTNTKQFQTNFRKKMNDANIIIAS